MDDDFIDFRKAVYDYFLEKYPESDIIYREDKSIANIEIFCAFPDGHTWICGLEVLQKHLKVIFYDKEIMTFEYVNPHAFSPERIERLIIKAWRKKLKKLEKSQKA